MSPLHKNSGECSYFDGKGWLHLTTADTLVSADISSTFKIYNGIFGEERGHPSPVLGNSNKLHCMVINGLMEVQRLNGRGRFSECKIRLLSCAEVWC